MGLVLKGAKQEEGLGGYGGEGGEKGAWNQRRSTEPKV